MAAPGAAYVRGDARALPFPPVFDAVVSLCQGGFGLLGGPAHDDAPVDPDGVVLDQVAGVLRPGGVVAMSAFSAYFQLRWLEESDTFDARRGVNHERTSIRNEAGEEREVDLWTSCFTPRELRLLAARAGLEVLDVWSVTPGAYRPSPPDIDQPELLLVARRP
jgi:SAM-dependent methyltransferase